MEIDRQFKNICHWRIKTTETKICAIDIFAQRSTSLRQNLKLTKKLILTLNLTLREELKG